MIGYLKRRLNERSTWLLMSTGIAGASQLTMPWAAIVAAIAVIAALVPDGAVKRPILNGEE